MELDSYLFRTLCPLRASVYIIWTVVVYIVWTIVNNVNLNPNRASYRDSTWTKPTETKDCYEMPGKNNVCDKPNIADNNLFMKSIVNIDMDINEILSSFNQNGTSLYPEYPVNSSANQTDIHVLRKTQDTNPQL